MLHRYGIDRDRYAKLRAERGESIALARWYTAALVGGAVAFAGGMLFGLVAAPVGF